MKFSKTKLAVATILALSFSSAQAAFINDNNIVISIVNNDIDGKSMLIDTKVLASDVINGNVTTFTSNTDLTAAISNFITGGTKVIFWAGGRWKDGLSNNTLSTTPILDTKPEIDTFSDTNLPAFISLANTDVFKAATVGLTESWVVDIPAGNTAHFINPNTNGAVGSVLLGADGVFTHSNSGFFTGINTYALSSWRLDTDGTLTYGVPAVSAVPVPAAVWLFGSGLLGLVGVARRKA